MENVVGAGLHRDRIDRAWAETIYAIIQRVSVYVEYAWVLGAVARHNRNSKSGTAQQIRRQNRPSKLKAGRSAAEFCERIYPHRALTHGRWLRRTPPGPGLALRLSFHLNHKQITACLPIYQRT